MRHLSSGTRTRIRRPLRVCVAAPLALCGLLLAARLGTVRANAAEEFELDIITMVLLGGVSIFGGTGTMIGVGLSILVVLNLRNGMSLAHYSGNIQTSVVGTLLIASVLLPNLLRDARQMWLRRGVRKRPRPVAGAQEEEESRQTADPKPIARS